MRPWGPPCLPGLPGPDIVNTDPEIIRREVVPGLMQVAEECLAKGSISQDQFHNFMLQVTNS